MTDPDPAAHAASTDDPGLALLALLGRLPGGYAGAGTDADAGDFDATASLTPVAGGAAVQLEVAITGAEPYGEHGVFGRGETGALRYVGVSTNAPFLREYELRRTGSGDGWVRAVFGWGGPVDAAAAFREELTVTVYADGDLGLAWAWGVPGGPFAPRAEARLSAR